jgi:hypothetical protein
MPIGDYTVTLRGEPFLISYDQLHFDAPNYFTTLFEGPFREATEGKHEATLYRDPSLFRIIETYLSGYEIFPLPDGGWPKYMSKKAVMKNLIDDAKFYGFERLVLLLETEAKQDKEKKYRITIEVRLTHQNEVIVKILTGCVQDHDDYGVLYKSKAAEIDAIDVAWIIRDVSESWKSELDLLTRCAMSRVMSEGVSADLDIRWETVGGSHTKWHIFRVSGGESANAQTSPNHEPVVFRYND